MLVIGWFTIACGLAAAYLAFTKGDLPAWMYGHLSRRSPPPLLAVRRPVPPPLVHWRDWNASALKDAKKKNRLTLLNLYVTWSRPCHRLDETFFNDPAATAFIEKEFIPVRVDADVRPDMALRYLFSPESSFIGLLLPSGARLGETHYYDYGREFILPWAQTMVDAYRGHAGYLDDAVRRQAELFDAKPIEGPMPPFADIRKFAGGRRIPFPKPYWYGLRIRLLANKEALCREVIGSRIPADSIWGGYFSDENYMRSRYEKLLEDQANGIRVMSSCIPDEARRAQRYVDRFLTNTEGGYFASQSGELKRTDGSVVEGEFYFAKDESRRRALGVPAVDKRIFAAGNGAMAAAILDSQTVLHGAGKVEALRTLERWWKEGVRAGGVRHQLLARDSVAGLLVDQLALAEGFAASYEATGDRRQIKRAVEIVRWVESNLMNEQSGALYDRIATGELPPELDRLLLPQPNLQALAVYQRLVSDLPVGDPMRERLKARCRGLSQWLWPRRQSLASAELAVLAADDYNGTEKHEGGTQ